MFFVFREQAVVLGQALIDGKWIMSTTINDNLFHDDHTLYRPVEVQLFNCCCSSMMCVFVNFFLNHTLRLLDGLASRFVKYLSNWCYSNVKLKFILKTLAKLIIGIPVHNLLFCFMSIATIYIF